jgi:hypothetical protein
MAMAAALQTTAILVMMLSDSPSMLIENRQRNLALLRRKKATLVTEYAQHAVGFPETCAPSGALARNLLLQIRCLGRPP